MKKEISFWKTQWFNILVGALCLLVAFTFIIRAALSEVDVGGNCLAAFIWTISSAVWIVTALADYNNLRIKKLQDRVDALEYCAITEIVEESPNHYMVKRRLGPDKED